MKEKHTGIEDDAADADGLADLRKLQRRRLASLFLYRVTRR